MAAALCALTIIIGSGLIGGCSNMSHLVSAKPLEEGQIRMTFANAGTVRLKDGSIDDGMYALDFAVQGGVHERLSIGARIGFPHGISVNALTNLVKTKAFALSLDPLIGINPWYMDEDYSHFRVELPVVIGFLVPGGHELTLIVGYGAWIYFDGGDEKVVSPTGQYVTAQISARIALDRRRDVGLMPYISYSHFVRGKRIHGSQKLVFGIGITVF